MAVCVGTLSGKGLAKLGAWWRPNHSNWSKRDEDALMRDSYGVGMSWPIFILGQCCVKLLLWLMDNFMPAGLRVQQTLLGGCTISQCVLALTSLGVPEALGNGPLTVTELAKVIGVKDVEGLGRVLAFAIALGYFAEVNTGVGPVRYRNNRLSACLRENHLQTQKAFITQSLSLVCTSLAALPTALKEKRPAYKIFHGENADFWSDLKADPDKENLFSQSMASIEKLYAGVMLHDIPWKRWNRVVDVGGAYGSVLASILGQHSHLSGILFDRPQVVERGEEAWRADPVQSKLLERVEFAGGSFFDAESLPKGKGKKDVFFLRSILHDWDDESCSKILRALHTAIGSSGATLLLVDPMPHEPTTHLVNYGCLTSDVLMMVSVQGKERRKTELEALLNSAGFRLAALHQTRSIFTAVEAYVMEPSSNASAKHD
eukprot:jgi/Botrbrau1/20934/Bobra.0135s0062.1